MNTQTHTDPSWKRTQRIGGHLFAASLGSVALLVTLGLFNAPSIAAAAFWSTAALSGSVIILLSMLLKLEFERMKQRLNEQAKKLKSKNEQLHHVAFTARHDLRGALDGLAFSTDLLREQISAKEDETDVQEVVNLLDMDIAQQQQLLDGLKEWLELVREEAMEHEEVDVNDLLSDIATEVSDVANMAHDALPRMKVCRSTFRQALQRLIENSITHNDHEVPEVYVYQEQGAIVVEDNGCGFDATSFEKLCQPFQRLSGRGNGSGMGLAIAKGIFSNHGFELSAESTPGKGSRVMIHTGG